ncbi:HPr family phosphocarrier protein [Lactonifactor longoviformis]|uniref:Phosphocarrier protein HPr n=1 Tax=Lactonifactor longoviformis DSM 17459 TaxID=1122155 RepID=A0A1M4URT4_9CLOT|nr:HPr family phosphocarrier protein [Lactonifactor longoviformis]POP30310.1 HPr family phosphocarrier protein [Lactonifactor longoviformis]SHE59461.1 phosphocarrier protein [Lactonifactor longoviformis DSM 17459]
MYSKKATVINAVGLHARPAAEFVKMAKKFNSKIILTKENDPKKTFADGKSIMSVMALCAGTDTIINIEAEGEDENKAVDSLVKLVESGFGE